MNHLFTTACMLLLAGCAASLSPNDTNALKQELQQMRDIDQIAANVPQGAYKSYPEKVWQAFKDSVFFTNYKKADSIFHKHGFPGYNKVGKEGATNFWLVVQHCDAWPAFQRQVLQAMDKQVKKQNATARDFAYLTDRVKINANEKQVFGTQVTYEVATTGRAVPKIGLTDSLHVDSLRKAYGLETLKEYLNMMTSLHYEMNKQHYMDMGITQLNLYP